MKPKSHLDTLVAALLYALTAALYLRALLPQFTTHIAPDPYDPLFNVCVLDWVSRASFLGLHAALQFPIFFPSPDVLAYSDHFLGLGLLLGAVRPLLDALGVGPLTLYNSLYFGSFVLAGASLFWVARRLGIGRTAAFLGGFAYAFSHPRWDQSSHLQMLWAPVLPLVLWSFDQLLERPSRRTAAAFVALFAVHLTGGAYLAYMVNLALAGMAGTRLIDRSGREAIRRGWQAIAAAAIVAGLLLGLFLLPYAVAEREAGMQRTLVETQQFSGTAISWLQPSQWSWYERAFPGDLRRNENSLFLGFAVTLTLALAAVARARGGVRRLTENPELWIGLGVAAVAVLATEAMTWGSHFGYRRRLPPLSGGYIVGLFLLLVGCGIAFWAARRHRRPVPAATDGAHATSRRAFLAAGVLCTAACFPVVFIPLRYLLPGLEGMRVPSRFALVAIIPWTLLAAAAWDGWLNRAALPKRRWALGGLAGLLLLELFPRPLPTYALEDLTNLPQVYREVETNPAVSALLELPLAGKEEDEVRYMWRQLRHRKPIFNGYSGFEPEEHDRLRVALRTKPAREMPNGPEFERLRHLGITHALVRHHSFSAPRDRRTFEHLVRRGILRPITPPGSPRLYMISAPEAP